MRKFKSVNELVNTLKPDYPVYCMRPAEIKKSVNFFKENFPGKILYAVKTNPHEKILKKIITNGINDFDVASLKEIKLMENTFLNYKSDSSAKSFPSQTILQSLQIYSWSMHQLKKYWRKKEDP